MEASPSCAAALGQGCRSTTPPGSSQLPSAEQVSSQTRHSSPDSTAGQTGAWRQADAAVPPAVPSAPPPATASPLDQQLLKQPFASAVLLPTPTNVNPIHIARDDLLHFVSLQQWVAAQLGIRLPLLNGMFVLVPSAELRPPPLQPLPASPSLAVTSSSGHSNSMQVAAAIPWRLRQVSAVEAAPGADPADTTLVLVGGDRVRAGQASASWLTDVQDYEYLCCEVADMQQSGRLRQLRVFDEAHMSWRLKVACDLHTSIEACNGQDQADLPAPSAEGHKAAHEVLRSLPPDDWIHKNVLPNIELNPLVWPESPDQPWQLLSAEQHTQLLQGAAAAWQHYVQHKLSGQQPQPVIAFVPWRAVEALEVDQVQQVDAAAGGAAADTATASGSPSVRVQSAAQGAAAAAAGGSAAVVAGMAEAPAGWTAGSTLQEAPAAADCHLPAAGSGAAAVSTHRGNTGIANSSCSTDSSSGSDDSDSSCSSAATNSSDSDGESAPPARRSSSCSRSWVRGRGRPLGCRSVSISKPICGMLLARLARKPANSHYHPKSAWSVYIELRAQLWLQQLALKMEHWASCSHGEQQLGHSTPLVPFNTVASAHPLPPDVVWHYGSVGRFARARRELEWEERGTGDRHLRLVPEARTALLAMAQLSQQIGPPPAALQQPQRLASQAEEGQLIELPEQQEQHQEQEEEEAWPQYLVPQKQQLCEAVARVTPLLLERPIPDTATLAAARELSRGKARGRSRSHSRSRARSSGCTPRTHGRVRSRSRSRSRSRGRASPYNLSRSRRQQQHQPAAGRDARGRSSAATPKRDAEHVAQQVQEWLLQLAKLLQPVRRAPSRPTCIKLRELRDRLPLPRSIILCYGSVRDFVDCTPALEWADSESRHRNYISLVPLYHQRLLNTAAEAAISKRVYR